MTIGIIGAGHIGSNLARLFAKAGESVLVAGSGATAETARKLGSIPGVRAASVAEAVNADMVVLALPWAGLDTVWPHRSALKDKIVLDVTNPYKRDLLGVEDLGGRRSSAIVQAQLRGALIVKTFNKLNYKHLIDGARPAGADDRIALAVAGDDLNAKRTVIALMDKAGFTGIDAGGIAETAPQEPDGKLYGSSMNAIELGRALAARAA